VMPNASRIDLAALRSIAESRHLSLITETAGTSIPYGLWDDRRAALRAFVRHLGGPG
jgi:hypothetical protein